MQNYDQTPIGLGFVWAFAGLAIIALLLFGGWRAKDLMFTDPQIEPIYDSCIDTYGDNQCRCFSGIMSVQLSRYSYQIYAQNLEDRARQTRFFDGGLARDTLSGRDLRVCIDASDICGVPVCEPPRFDRFDTGLGSDSREAPYGQPTGLGGGASWGEDS